MKKEEPCNNPNCGCKNYEPEKKVDFAFYSENEKVWIPKPMKEILAQDEEKRKAKLETHKWIQCSRCRVILPGVNPPDGTCTAGYYVVSEGYWKRFAHPHESFLCDECMWKTPAYIAIYGETTAEKNASCLDCGGQVKANRIRCDGCSASKPVKAAEKQSKYITLEDTISYAKSIRNSLNEQQSKDLNYLLFTLRNARTWKTGAELYDFELNVHEKLKQFLIDAFATEPAFENKHIKDRLEKAGEKPLGYYTPSGRTEAKSVSTAVFQDSFHRGKRWATREFFKQAKDRDNPYGIRECWCENPLGVLPKI